jgi:hypothetical protein
MYLKTILMRFVIDDADLLQVVDAYCYGPILLELMAVLFWLLACCMRCNGAVPCRPAVLYMGKHTPQQVNICQKIANFLYWAQYTTTQLKPDHDSRRTCSGSGEMLNEISR